MTTPRTSSMRTMSAMSERMYTFRKDSGEIVEVDFDTMMTQQQQGMIQLADGSWAKRVQEEMPESQPAAELASHPILSDTLGFPDHQFGQMRQHLEQSGVRGIEFVRDKHYGKFIQVKCDSEQAKLAYAKSRQFADRNSTNGSGAMLSPELLEKTKELVSR
jgi:hypothetical protein